MIELTRLDRSQVLVNSDLIVSVEQTPDTILTFINGSHMMVRESIAEITERVVQFRRRIHQVCAAPTAPEA